MSRVEAAPKKNTEDVVMRVDRWDDDNMGEDFEPEFCVADDVCVGDGRVMLSDCFKYATLLHVLNIHQHLSPKMTSHMLVCIWVSLKMLGIFPMTASHFSKRDNDQQNQTGYNGVLTIFRHTHIFHWFCRSLSRFEKCLAIIGNINPTFSDKPRWTIQSQW